MGYDTHNTDTSSTGGCGCTDDLPYITQKKTITAFRSDYCKEMYELLGGVRTLEVRRDKLVDLIAKKQCWFVWTERNYRIVRNLDIMIGTELSQAGDSIKEGVKNYLDSNKKLAEALKKIAKTVKDVLAKANEFRQEACKLENCKEDPCNCSQVYILTGEKPEGGCKSEPPAPTKSIPENCNQNAIKEIIKNLLCIPKNLATDINSISKSATNVLGIQTFSNITTLDPLQGELSDRIKKFGKQVTDVAKKGEGDLKAAIEDLTKSKKEQAKTDVELFAKRSDFEGVKKTVAYFCCLPCSCVQGNAGDCAPRLHKCEKEICEICKDIQNRDCKPEGAQAQTTSA